MMNLKHLILIQSILHASCFASGGSPYYGEVVWLATNFCPKGFVKAEGQLLPISQNTAIFSLFGTQYGGNGKSNFAIPDLRGRFGVGQGQGEGLTPVEQGEQVGVESYSMSQLEMPYHTHPLSLQAAGSSAFVGVPKIKVCSDTAEERQPIQNYLAKTQTASYDSVPANSVDTLWAVKSKVQIQTGVNGGNQSIPMVSPYVVLTPCISLQGAFPPRP